MCSSIFRTINSAQLNFLFSVFTGKICLSRPLSPLLCLFYFKIVIFGFQFFSLCEFLCVHFPYPNQKRNNFVIFIHRTGACRGSEETGTGNGRKNESKKLNGKYWIVSNLLAKKPNIHFVMRRFRLFLLKFPILVSICLCTVMGVIESESNVEKLKKEHPKIWHFPKYNTQRNERIKLSFWSFESHKHRTRENVAGMLYLTHIL